MRFTNIAVWRSWGAGKDYFSQSGRFGSVEVRTHTRFREPRATGPDRRLRMYIA